MARSHKTNFRWAEKLIQGQCVTQFVREAALLPPIAGGSRLADRDRLIKPLRATVFDLALLRGNVPPVVEIQRRLK